MRKKILAWTLALTMGAGLFCSAGVTSYAADKNTSDDVALEQTGDVSDDAALELTEDTEVLRAEKNMVALTKENFPDDEFRKWLTSRYGKDGYIDANKIETLSLPSNGGFSDLTGIEFFPNLKKLVCSSQYLSSLDVSKNTALTELTCNDNSLSSLDVSKNIALTKLNCNKNNLSSLIMGKNTALTELRCDENKLSSLDVSQAPVLKTLYCRQNNLSKLDLSKNTTLDTIHCDKNNLSSLDVSKNTALTVLDCDENKLSGLDVSKNTDLYILSCSDNNLRSLDVSKNTRLSSLYCDNNSLTSLDLSKNLQLSTLACDYESVRNVVSKRLSTLDLYVDSAVTSLDLSEFDSPNKLISKIYNKCDATTKILTLLPNKWLILTDSYGKYNWDETAFGIWIKKSKGTSPSPQDPQPQDPQPQDPQPQTPQSQVTPAVDTTYHTHIQTYGDKKGNSMNGQMSGTSGESKRLESIWITVDGGQNLGIQYTTHCQTYGWLPWSANGEVNGTSGESKRLEAIKIQLTGADKYKYDVYYRVHAQSYGWLGWAKNGEPSGTAGYAKRLEGIQIVVVKRGDAAPGLDFAGVTASKGKYDSRAYIAKTAGTITIPGYAYSPNVMYKTHVQKYGWQAWKTNGQMSGTSGEAKRLEGINIKLSNCPYSGGIAYTTHVQKYGWQGNENDPTTWKKNGAMSGTSGEAKRLEAIRIQLTGEMAEHYDIYYRVHAQTYGWLGWAKNGEASGTAGYAKRLEGIQIVLVPKGGAAPANNYGGAVSKRTEAYIQK